MGGSVYPDEEGVCCSKPRKGAIWTCGCEVWCWEYRELDGPADNVGLSFKFAIDRKRSETYTAAGIVERRGRKDVGMLDVPIGPCSDAGGNDVPDSGLGMLGQYMGPLLELCGGWLGYEGVWW